MIKNLRAPVWLAPAAMMVGALIPWPYGYYQVLRLVAFVASAFLAYAEYQDKQTVTIWIALLVAIAFVFNPVFPQHLNRGIWSVLNLIAACIFVAHWRVCSKR